MHIISYSEANFTELKDGRIYHVRNDHCLRDVKKVRENLCGFFSYPLYFLDESQDWHGVNENKN